MKSNEERYIEQCLEELDAHSSDLINTKVNNPLIASVLESLHDEVINLRNRIKGKTFFFQDDLLQELENLSDEKDQEWIREKFPQIEETINSPDDLELMNELFRQRGNILSRLEYNLKRELGNEVTLSLTTVMHARVLYFLHENTGYIDNERRKDVDLLMSVLIKPYLNNSFFIASISQVIPQLSSEYLKYHFQKILDKHQYRPFKNHYMSNINITSSSIDPNIPTKPHERFTRNLMGKPDGGEDGSLGFKTIIPSDTGKFNKYLNLWLIKIAPETEKRLANNGKLSAQQMEVNNANIIRQQQTKTTGKERYVEPDNTGQPLGGEVASKIFSNFMTIGELYRRSFPICDSTINKPIDNQYGLILGKPLKGFEAALKIMWDKGSLDPHQDNIGFIDQGEYLQAELIDFGFYGFPREFFVKRRLFYNDSLFGRFKIFDQNEILFLEKILEYSRLSDANYNNENEILFELNKIFLEKETFFTELSKINPWLWKKVLTAYDKSNKGNPLFKKILCEWMMDAMITKMKQFPIQQSEAVNYFMDHPLSLEILATNNGETSREVLLKIFRNEHTADREKELVIKKETDEFKKQYAKRRKTHPL